MIQDTDMITEKSQPLPTDVLPNEKGIRGIRMPSQSAREFLESFEILRKHESGQSKDVDASRIPGGDQPALTRQQSINDKSSLIYKPTGLFFYGLTPDRRCFGERPYTYGQNNLR
jgi:hypothetical protein